ncbi:ATP-dependent helicase [candidate division WOR-3 bacterium]|nr:ATP-dependent helicase [candidate division WOR-3 bacterium]
MLIDYRRELNEEQQTCITAGDGAIYVLAGAGSGKTRVLTYRTAWLIENGVAPESIMLLTFTNKAAREMLLRVEILTQLNLRNLWGGTFHHIGNLALRRTGGCLGIASDFIIIDQGDAVSFLEECTRECKIEKERKFPKARLIKEIISRSISSLKDIPTTVKERFPHLIQYTDDLAKIEKRYRKKKRKENLMDFDDLLYYWWKVLSNGNFVHNLEQILVDEYQDTNLLQAKIVDKIAEKVGNITVVGDDAQSIYSFRGANYENIRDFPLRYPCAKIYKLETNYRSTPEILNLANQIIERLDVRFKKRLVPMKASGELPTVVATKDPYTQAKFIVSKIKELINQGSSYKDIGVLYRAHYQSLEIEIEFSKSDIPYVVRSGVRFFERAHIKDVLSYLRIVANPRDSVSFKRALMLEQGIGSITAQKIYGSVSRASSPFQEFLSYIPDRAIAGVNNMKKVLANITNLSPSRAIKFIYNETYQEYLELSYQDAEERKGDILALIDLAEGYKSSLRFLSEVTLSEPATGEDYPSNNVVLSTIHRAKGLEWDTLFVVYLVDGGLPIAKSYESQEHYEEERRLFYVGVTRAKKELYITYPMSSKKGYLSASPFLTELDKSSYRIMWL